MEGNQQKMREALEFVHDKLLTWNYTDKATAKMAVAVVDRCSKALSEPPRQCDVGTAEEQVDLHREWCSRDNDSSYCCNDCRDCFARWAQMPYEAQEGAVE